MSPVDHADLSDFRSTLAGPVLTADNADYDEVRALWNGMVDKRPALIVRCHDRADVVAALAFAQTHKLEIAVRGAGHNIAGNASCDAGMMIDLSTMDAVEVDLAANMARVQPGVTLGQLDAATQAHGLAVPVGINSTTGIAGLTLGGGFGWLCRRYGMTVDALRGAEVITVDGEILYASEQDNAELFWALRGGGGNFGIVTRFDFELYPLGPEVMAGLMVFPLEQAESVLTQYRDWILKTPVEFNTWVVMRHAPPLPFLDESVHGTKVAVLAVCHTGEQAEGEALVKQLRGFGQPVGEHIGMMPFVDWQQAFDPLLAPGARNYWKTHNFTAMEDGLIQAAVKEANGLAGPECEVFFACIAGVANRVSADAMAWNARDARFVMNVHARWQEASDDDACINWARSVFASTRPFASGGAYVNFMTDEEGARVQDAYANNFDKLVAVKRQYDPDNRLHLNQNIRPD
ncbi:FAD-binding oxidoreductase [Ferrimonas marina]|uniref:FAD/FMN-containing dehydrogenase n=1 Tax=Ferrimonas marina TaxID=299255 RepID=A0A1M5S4V3_9GAMM|nr:FAD-binding oxidoreductase [Ferrimonas marina]SHH33003.1 FAD/FMN-containing dehydrogenase [Ferrimonas marina]